MSHEAIAILMFTSMLLMLLTGQRVFGAIGFVSAATALALYGNGAVELPFNAAFKLTQCPVYQARVEPASGRLDGKFCPISK